MFRVIAPSQKKKKKLGSSSPEKQQQQQQQQTASWACLRNARACLAVGEQQHTRATPLSFPRKKCLKSQILKTGRVVGDMRSYFSSSFPYVFFGGFKDGCQGQDGWIKAKR